MVVLTRLMVLDLRSGGRCGSGSESGSRRRGPSRVGGRRTSLLVGRVVVGVGDRLVGVECRECGSEIPRG